MRCLSGYRMRLMFVGFVIAVVLCSGNMKADFTFGQRVNLGPVVNSPYGDYDPSITPDGLSLYFSSTRPGGLGREDIWVTTRATVSDPWRPPVNLGAPVNSEYREGYPSITADGLTLAFVANTPGGLGGWDIWLTTRPTKESPWGPPMNLGSPINSASDDYCGCISPDGCSLYFSNSLSSSPTNPDIVYGGDIYVTTRPTADSSWGPPVNLGLMPSRSGSGNWNPSISADGLAIFFDSDYANVSLFPDIWLATRISNDGEWGTPILLGPEINTRDGEQKSSISADGSTIYWCSGGSDFSKWDLWQASITPIVDFNGDGQVAIEDLIMCIENWGQNEPAFDMGPMPWGDGIVDAADLEVLMSYWGQEVYNLHLLAHWKLDETEGDVAYDSAAKNDAILLGEVTWAPENGHVDGALNFDGIDDYIETPQILNPAKGAFSVFAWIMGGAPGQVILSQTEGMNWLMIDPEQGTLRTSLTQPTINIRGKITEGPSLISSIKIMDENWHRVGLVWDGSHRILYVDDSEVARDTIENLDPSIRGLYLGAGSKLEAGSFWSGMIDDVRIYNRVVTP